MSENNESKSKSYKIKANRTVKIILKKKKE